jgi:hypothetical protein
MKKKTLHITYMLKHTCRVTLQNRFVTFRFEFLTHKSHKAAYPCLQMFQTCLLRLRFGDGHILGSGQSGWHAQIIRQALYHLERYVNVSYVSGEWRK